MKRNSALIGVLILIGIALYVFGNVNVHEYVRPNVIEKTVEVTPDWAEDQDAVEAAQAVIRKKELEAELEVLNGEIDTRQQRVIEIEKELGTY